MAVFAPKGRGFITVSIWKSSAVQEFGRCARSNNIMSCFAVVVRAFAGRPCVHLSAGRATASWQPLRSLAFCSAAAGAPNSTPVQPCIVPQAQPHCKLLTVLSDREHLRRVWRGDCALGSSGAGRCRGASVAHSSAARRY